MLPLCVDLDGTLIYDDVALMTLKDYVDGRRARLFKILVWVMQGGRCFVKYKLSQLVSINPAHLQYNKRFLKYLEDQKASGRPIYLATGCCEKYANEIANYIGLFDDVFSSTKDVNLVGNKKAELLVDKFGEGGFAYAGNSVEDVFVWVHAGEKIVVNPSNGVIEHLKGREYWLFE